MAALSAEQIQRILVVTDALNLHREAIFIPLRTENNEELAVLPDGTLRIVAPSNVPFDEWLSSLRGRLEKMDISKVRRN